MCLIPLILWNFIFSFNDNIFLSQNSRGRGGKITYWIQSGQYVDYNTTNGVVTEYDARTPGLTSFVKTVKTSMDLSYLHIYPYKIIRVGYEILLSCLKAQVQGYYYEFRESKLKYKTIHKYFMQIICGSTFFIAILSCEILIYFVFITI